MRNFMVLFRLRIAGTFLERFAHTYIAREDQ